MSRTKTTEYLDEIQSGFAQHGVDENHPAFNHCAWKSNPRAISCQL